MYEETYGRSVEPEYDDDQQDIPEELTEEQRVAGIAILAEEYMPDDLSEINEMPDEEIANDLDCLGYFWNAEKHTWTHATKVEA